MEYTRYIYNPINWLNKSESLATPLGKTNLNHMESGIYNIAENLDVVYNEMSTGKFDKSDASKVITGMPTWNPNTGVLTFRFYDGTVFQVDFNVEKIPVSFSMDSAGVITMTTSDGTQWTADIGDVIPTYTFKDTDTIAFSDEKNGDYVHTVSAQIKKGSITGDYLQPNYLNDVTIQANNAKASAKNAKEYEDNAAYDAKLAQSYAVGGSGIREGENEDCAKAYKEKAELAAEEAGGYLADLQSVKVTGVKGNSETTYRKGNVNITPANIGLGSVGNYKAVSTVASQGLTDTEKTNARSNIGAAPTSHASTATTYGVSTAANYGHAMASSTVPKANGTATAGSETAKFARGDHVHPAQTSVSGSSGSCTGNAATATKLATARSLKTNLASTAAANFDGSANITPGVTGTLSVTNGGTGRPTLTPGQVLEGNGTSTVALRPIDTTVGGTANSTALITSGAVYSTMVFNSISITGTGNLSISSIFAGDYSDMIFELSANNQMYTWAIPTGSLPSSGQLHLISGYKTGNYEGLGEILITGRTTAKISNCIFGGTQYNSTAVLRIKYR